MTLEEIKALDAGSWFGEAHGGLRFLTLAEALDIVGGRTRLNVHVKAHEEDRHLVVPLTVQELVSRSLLDTAFLASDQESLVLAREHCPELSICNLTTQPTGTYITRSLDIGCRILQPGNAQVDGPLVAEAHRHGLEVNPFYADDEVEMRRLIACGVDGILTNWPDKLLALREGP